MNSLRWDGTSLWLPPSFPATPGCNRTQCPASYYWNLGLCWRGTPSLRPVPHQSCGVPPFEFHPMCIMVNTPCKILVDLGGNYTPKCYSCNRRATRSCTFCQDAGMCSSKSLVLQSSTRGLLTGSSRGSRKCLSISVPDCSSRICNFRLTYPCGNAP